MLISEINIRNFKSFGNNTNTIKLNLDQGELILVVGKNGEGKSSMLESIDFTAYGKVRGKKKKYQTNSSLPNRLNQNLDTSIVFKTGNHEIKIERGLAPNHLRLFIDGEDYDRAGKSNIQDKINQIIGMDIEAFKSFISLSVNDFKNFMSLTNEEKKILLDKLFNLELINTLNKVLVEKRKQNKHQKEIFDTEIRTYESSLISFRESIERLKQISEESDSKQIEEYKQLILDKKTEFDKLQETIKKGKEKESEYNNKIHSNNETMTDMFYKIKDYKSKIAVFETGNCPTCESVLTSDSHIDILTSMKETVAKLSEIYIELEKEKKELTEKQLKISQVLTKTITTFTELKAYLVNIKSNITRINESKTDTSINNDSINEMISNIEKLESKKIISKKRLDEKDMEESVMDELKKILSEDGIKKSIISKIVVPINSFVSENLEKLGIRFNVVLDDQFNAIISEMGEELELDTLSTGETKRVNIAIMLAYLKLIRMKKHVNLLFLDEVFSSIDIDGIYSILDILKDFARDNNINIFLIHHAMLDKSSFDRVIRIQKDITSNIIEE